MKRRSPEVVAALVALLYVGGLTSAAEHPTGPTVVTEAPDRPSVRASFAFPVGWRVEASSGDAARRSVNALTIDERCEVGTRRSDFTDLATDIDDFEITLAPGSGYIFIKRETVSLPAGPAERVDFAANEEGGRWSVYAVWDDGFVHELWCRGDELGGDRWRAVAETLDLEPDPGEGTPFTSLVERPDAGVAMSFPEAWQVRGSSTNQGLLYATSDTAVCALSDYSDVAEANGWATVDAMHDAYVSNATAREDLHVVETAYLELPAGRAGVADIAFGDGTRALRYSFADGERGTLVALFCIGDPTPDDRYRSLAESVTWLSPSD
jgi:hypothetical protein